LLAGEIRIQLPDMQLTCKCLSEAMMICDQRSGVEGRIILEPWKDSALAVSGVALD
jgi:hypothetical protein